MMPASTSTHFDFGYPWWLSYGHLPILVGIVLILGVGLLRKWSWAPILFLGLLAVWSGAALVIQRFILDIGDVPDLPTQNFLHSGAGRVLDMGAGTGRSSIMVLRSRPRVTLVAVDLFSDSFDQHFGKGASPQERLRTNLNAAGAEQRTTIDTADVRNLPFGAAEFDGVVSAYTIDHLNRKGSDQALAEAARVLRPGGDFLLMVVSNDNWAKFVFGPLLAHGGTRGAAWWSEHTQNAGFQILEQGTRPVTLYFLARRS